MGTLTEHPRTHSHAHDGPVVSSPPGPFEAVRRHPFLTLLPILLLTGAAIALGLTREPTYTSEARLSVGELNPSVQSAPGIVEANQQLASAYSRAVKADAVLRPVERELGLARGAAASRLSATPVAESPILVIEGTGDTRGEATEVADTASQALVRYIRSLGADESSGERILDRLRDARVEESRAEEAVDVAETPETEAALENARLKVRALQQAYLDETQGGGTTPVQIINPADTATSDERSFLKLAVTGGVLAGIALGVALATLRAAARHRREQRRRYELPAL
jgi:uncharacterized protein involved in exopolysaccharide biosynthesis